MTDVPKRLTSHGDDRSLVRLGRNKEVPTSCERYRRSNHESVQIEISTVRREAPRSIIGFLPL